MNKVYLIVLLLLAFFPACEKENPTAEDPVRKEDPVFLFAGISVLDAVNYGADSIYVKFKLNIIGSSPPYLIGWISPDTLTGTGPFELMIREDLVLDVNVADSVGQYLKIEQTLLFDVDFSDPVNDYRANYPGDFLFTILHIDHSLVGIPGGGDYWDIDSSTTEYMGTVEALNRNQLLITCADGDPAIYVCNPSSTSPDTILHRSQFNPRLNTDWTFTPNGDCLYHDRTFFNGLFLSEDTLYITYGGGGGGYSDIYHITGIRSDEPSK